jgi:Ca-activated chloride channel family protein
LQFGVLCRFTAFVAVDRSEQVNAGGKVQRFVQPVDLPAGWQTAPVVYSPPSSPMPADGSVLGLMITTPILSVLKSFKRSRSRDDVLTLRFLTASEAEPPRISADNGQGDMADSHRWVAELLQLLQDGKDQPLSERKDILRSLLKKLQQMLSDLQRSRLAQELYQPLQQLESKLSIFVTESAGEALDEQLLQQYWEETENTLRRFQAELAKESSSRRCSFWK